MKTPTIREIQEVVAQRFGVTVLDLISARQGGGICVPRHLAMQMARGYGHTYTAIGDAFRRDHTSVMQAVKKATILPRFPHSSTAIHRFCGVDSSSDHRIEVGL